MCLSYHAMFNVGQVRGGLAQDAQAFTNTHFYSEFNLLITS